MGTNKLAVERLLYVDVSVGVSSIRRVDNINVGGNKINLDDYK